MRFVECRRYAPCRLVLCTSYAQGDLHCVGDMFKEISFVHELCTKRFVSCRRCAPFDSYSDEFCTIRFVAFVVRDLCNEACLMLKVRTMTFSWCRGYVEGALYCARDMHNEMCIV